MGISSIQDSGASNRVAMAPQSPDGAWIVLYAAAVLTAFIPLYLFTRSSILIGDAGAFIAVARTGDPALLHYGEPSHFLQVPLARGVWRACEVLGLPIGLDSIFVGFSVVGTLAAIVFVGLIAAELLRSRAAAWLAGVLFGTSLHVWSQLNGELYGLALGFVAAGLFFALRGRIVVPAGLWALSVLSHVEFALAAPVFVLALWMSHPSAPIAQKLRNAVLLLMLAATVTLVVLLLGSWVLGKWSDSTSFVKWLLRSYETRQQDHLESAEVIRAIKGLVTAHTVAGHYWRDILTGRGAWQNPAFVVASGVGLLVLLATGAFLAAAVWQRRLVAFGLVWLLPFHTLFNWWFVPTVEKYHAGALPGLSLLLTGGLVHLGTRMRKPAWYGLAAGYVATCAALNLFGAIIPMQALARDTAIAEREIRQLQAERGGRAVFVTCDSPRAVVEAGVPYLRIRSIWEGSVPEIQEAILAWTRARMGEGGEAYVLDRWCLPEEWITSWSREPFDLFFLERDFYLVPTRITGVPVAQSAPTNPFSWRRGDVVRLTPRSSR